MKNKKVFVTGGTGFVGSHVVEALLNQGSNVVVGIRSKDPKSYFYQKKLDEKAVLVNYDLKDLNRIFDIIGKYEINVVIHLGAQPIVPTAYKNPYETFFSNIMGTVNILEAARLYGGLEAVIVASSDKAYGKSRHLPYTEETSLKGNHPYDVSKSSADLIAQTYFNTYKLPISIARFGNVFGPGDINFNRLIPGIFEAVIKNKDFLVRSDGKMVREYVYVKDVVNGYVKLAQNINKIKGEAFNFGSENIFSVIDVIKKIEKILNIKVSYKILNTAKNEIPKQYLDWKKAKKTLNWQPKTSFENGIKESFAWYRNFYFSNNEK